MISKELIKNYPTYALYDVKKDGIHIYNECESYITEEEEKQSISWTLDEVDELFSQIAQGKKNNEIVRDYTGKRTEAALCMKLSEIRREIREMKGEIIREETTGLSLDYVISKELERGEIV